MTRALLIAALGLAACDGIDPLPLTNPYDPLAGSKGYEVTGPVGLGLVSATPTSAVLEWTDRSGGVASYEVRELYPDDDGTLRDSLVADLPVGATAHALDGLVRLGDRRFVVVGTFPDGGRSRPSNTLTLRYPRDEFALAMPDHPDAATFSSDGQRVFVGFYWFMNVYALDGDPAAEYTIRRQHTIPLTGPSGDVGLLTPDGDEIYRRIWSLGPDGAVAGVELAGATWLCSKFAASGDGARIAGQCVEDGGVEFVVWDAVSGERVEQWAASAALGDLAALASDPAVALFQFGGRVQAVGANRSTSWTVDAFDVEWVSVAVDGSRAVIANESPDFHGTRKGVIRIYDLASRRVVAERVGPLFGRPLDVRYGRVAYQVFTPFGYSTSRVDLTVRVASSATLETVRDVPVDAWPVASGSRHVLGTRLTESGLLAFLNDGTTVRWDFTRSWEVVEPGA